MSNPELTNEEAMALIAALSNVIWETHVLLNVRVDPVDLTDRERACNIAIFELFEKPFREFRYRRDQALSVINGVESLYPDKVDFDHLVSALRKINGREEIKKP